MWALCNENAFYHANFFGQQMDNRFTLMGAADVDGFIMSACEIVEREKGKDDLNEFKGIIDNAWF